MPVSVPEKTLEHWSSQYVTYRYRSKAALWWPANGEDIDVRWLPARPGKAIQLELKTTTPVGASLHDVRVDLGQLWEYNQLPPGRQPFYAFPQPDWDGDLTLFAIAQGRAVTELAFARSGSEWFADWMIVLPTAQVAAVLYPELMAHGSRSRGTRTRLVRFDSHHPTTPTWGPDPIARTPPSPKPVRWRTFWSELEQCGHAGWPQLIRLPTRIVQPRRWYQPTELIGMLQQAAEILGPETDNDEQLVTLEPNADGNYQITPAPDPNLGVSDDEARVDETDDRRQIVFLDARALSQGKSPRAVPAPELDSWEPRVRGFSSDDLPS
jgi:hypothetical protein